jgi:membrane protease YdiL (CAAX protease family)
VRAVSAVPELLRTVLPVLAAVLAAVAVDRFAARRGALPPGFTVPWRRAAALALLAALFWVGVFFALGIAGGELERDLSAVRPWELFTLHALLAAGLLAWGLLAHAGAPAPARAAAPEEPAETAVDPGAGPAEEAPPSLAARLARAFRLAEPHPGREVAVGMIAGAAIWGAVLAVVAAVAVALVALGFEGWLPEGPPTLVVFIAAQPFWIRLLGSLSAGVVEETFFRGFLQPRVGIGLSTLLFVLAHWTYGEPFMLVGVTLLSLTYAALTRWRGSVWAAVTAHAVFDGVQLLVLLPLATRALEAGGPLPELWLVGLW